MELHDRLMQMLAPYGALTIAVSGGVDSMTLAYSAHRFSSVAVSVVHAVSPAVPAAATSRVRAYALREGWRLREIDAGEFSDPTYRANPLDRCYYCKSHLYEGILAILAESRSAIASGANLNDLDDYRPGLRAAAERQVIHPFVECEIDKAGVRALAGYYGLTDIVDLPAQPCLASRVETGITINADDLLFIDLVEQQLRQIFIEQKTVRCRVTPNGIVIEIDRASASEMSEVSNIAASLCAKYARNYVGIRPYQRGSAFRKIS